jgi:type I restriction enzyme S subunit
MKFEKKRLGDIAQIIGGGTPSTKVSEYWDGDIAWLTPKDLSSFDGIYVARGSRSVTEAGLAASSAKMLPKASVLYTSRAPIGYVAIAEGAISTNQGFKSLVLKEGYVPEFLFYLLKASKTEIESHASGGTFAEISAKAFSDVELYFPPTKYQSKVADILLGLDNKIQTNKQLSKTLEEIAQTIFKSWFIDFDPVKAKMAGEKPVGMGAATAALFPDSMEDSELGLIPKGWSLGQMGDIFSLQGGYAFKSTSWVDSGVPVIKIGSVKPGFVDLNQVSYVTEQLASTISSEYKLEPGSMVIGLTGYVGEVGLVRSHTPFPLVNQRVAKFKRNNAPWSIPFTYCLTRRPEFKRQVEETATGTAQQNVSNSQILGIPTVVPPATLIELFESIFESTFERVITLADESIALGEIRDSLLPRLISGELQIPEEMLAS